MWSTRGGRDEGCLNCSDDLDFNEDENIDRNNQFLTPGGEHIHYIGERGSKPREGVFSSSLDIHKGLIKYVTDLDNQCISVFKTTGEFVTT